VFVALIVSELYKNDQKAKLSVLYDHLKERRRKIFFADEISAMPIISVKLVEAARSATWLEF